MSNFFKRRRRRRRHKRGLNTNVFKRMNRLLRRGWERVRGRARDHQQHQDFNYNDHRHNDYGGANANGQGAIFQDELFGFRVRVRIVENQV